MSEPQPIPQPTPTRNPAPEPGARTARSRLLADRAARWVVTAGGLVIIASILGILLFIVVEVIPLARAARVHANPLVPVAGLGNSVAVVSDEYRTHVALLSDDGWLRVVRADDGVAVDERQVLPDAERLARVQSAPGQQLLTASTSDGRVVAVALEWDISFVDDRRQVSPRPAAPVVFELDADGGPLELFAVRVDGAGAGVAVGLLADGTLAVLRREVEENLFTGETTESWDRSSRAAPEDLTALALDTDGSTVYGGTRSGDLITWDLARESGTRGRRTRGTPSPVTTLSLLLGDRSLIVGREDGSLGIWFEVRQPDETFRLTPIRRLPQRDHAIRRIAPSPRDKGFLAQDTAGGIGLYYSTSKRQLWNGSSPVADATGLFYTPKADGAFLAGPDGFAALEIDNPHPETSLAALFGRVWYEGYEKPAYVWQSSSGSDDFEPKLSMTPLIIGTLKGTVYSLFLAIPLGVLAAMYTSQFMNPSLKRVVKPTVEIMASLPSVVLGFLAGLWLAPRLERVFPALVAMLILAPLSVLATWAAIRALPRAWRKRFASGLDVLAYGVAISLTAWACLALNGPVERLFFGGSFPAWLLTATGLRYDQRNAVVVGLAMGFAVIPIIFAIAEDAFSNVPRNLVSGSLALGANRWQTVTRVVLPTASPGIFSAIMVGFGRAVGETMIVLMATGNTPIMDWNPFTGFRTLSANIAVEIPEAPQGATLYRTLFLAALLLFVMTFAINTAAEVVRQRLRRRYANI